MSDTNTDIRSGVSEGAEESARYFRIEDIGVSFIYIGMRLGIPI